MDSSIGVECAGCAHKFWICKPCWRGQSYCSEICREDAQRAHHRQAQSKYVKSAEVREDRAEYMVRYRLEQKNSSQKSVPYPTPVSISSARTLSLVQKRNDVALVQEEPPQPQDEKNEDESSFEAFEKEKSDCQENGVTDPTSPSCLQRVKPEEPSENRGEFPFVPVKSLFVHLDEGLNSWVCCQVCKVPLFERANWKGIE